MYGGTEMKCRIMNKRWMMTLMLLFGVVFLLIGTFGAAMTKEEQHMQMRMLGFSTGLGFALTSMAIFFMIRRHVLGKDRLRDEELSMTDERGQIIAYKTMIVTTFILLATALVVIIAATIRGDYFYMEVGAAGCFAVAIGTVIARRYYSSKL